MSEAKKTLLDEEWISALEQSALRALKAIVESPSDDVMNAGSRIQAAELLMGYTQSHRIQDERLATLERRVQEIENPSGWVVSKG